MACGFFSIRITPLWLINLCSLLNHRRNVNLTISSTGKTCQCQENGSGSKIVYYIALITHKVTNTTLKPFPHAKSQPAGCRAPPQLRRLTLSGHSIRSKCHESVMSSVTESGLKLWEADEQECAAGSG